MPRRGNGLRAEAYTPVAELDTTAADLVLAALREAGVAAYVLPASVSGDDPAATGADGVERLFVDARSRKRAERVLADRLLGTSAQDPEGATQVSGQEDPQMRDEDAIWQEIVADFDLDPGDDTPWPEREDVVDEEARVRIVRPAEAPRAEPPADYSDMDLDEVEEHFVPPPPPPLPKADAGTKFAWLALFGGPGYLLLAAALRWDVPGWAAFVSVAAFVGGFVALVMRMGEDRDDSGPDNGAVV